MRNAGVRFPWADASSRPLAHFLILRKGIFTMQAKKTNPEKTKNPEMLTLDSTYRIGNRSFIVEPVFKEEPMIFSLIRSSIFASLDSSLSCTLEAGIPVHSSITLARSSYVTGASVAAGRS